MNRATPRERSPVRFRQALWLCLKFFSLGLFLSGAAQAQPDDWRWQRFAAAAEAGEALARQYLPNQRALTYVNWRHLDGDNRIDAIVIVKNAKTSCAIAGTRCVAAVLTTGSAATPITLGVLGNFFPTAEPTFIRARPEDVRLWIAESRNNFVEVLLPRAPRAPWQASNERRTLRQASAEPGTVPLEEDDFASLDEQRAAMAWLRSNGAPPPAGAPFLYSGDTAAPGRDAVVRAIQTVLDRWAAAQPLDNTPGIDFSRCLSVGSLASERAIAQYMARAEVPAERARSIVVCTDEVPTDLDAESAKIIGLLWNSRLWVAMIQVTASTAYHPLRQAKASSGIVTNYLASFRAYADLARFSNIDAAGLMGQLSGLSAVAALAPPAVKAEADAFQSAVVVPARLAFICGVRDTSSLNAEAQRDIANARTARQADCEAVMKGVVAIP